MNEKKKVFYQSSSKLDFLKINFYIQISEIRPDLIGRQLSLVDDDVWR